MIPVSWINFQAYNVGNPMSSNSFLESCHRRQMSSQVRGMGDEFDVRDIYWEGRDQEGKHSRRLANLALK